MTRTRTHLANPEDLFWLELARRFGPQGDEMSEADLQAAWEVLGDEIIASWSAPCSRPWGWWRFVQ